MPWGPSDSIQDAQTVVPSDTATIKTTRSVWVGSTGNLVVTMTSGNSATFNNVPNGTWLPIQVTQVKATNTTASNIMALY